MPARRPCMAVGAVALALTGCGGDDDGPEPATSPPLTTDLRPIEEARDRGDFGRVPREQRALARTVIARDERLRDLLDGIGYRVGRMGPWTSGRSGSANGVLVDLRLDRPLTREAVWLPAVSYDREGHYYRDSRAHYRITEAEELTLLVEFRRAKVVSIEAEIGSSETYPDTPRKPPSEH